MDVVKNSPRRTTPTLLGTTIVAMGDMLRRGICSESANLKNLEGWGFAVKFRHGAKEIPDRTLFDLRKYLLPGLPWKTGQPLGWPNNSTTDGGCTPSQRRTDIQPTSRLERKLQRARRNRRNLKNFKKTSRKLERFRRRRICRIGAGGGVSKGFRSELVLPK